MKRFLAILVTLISIVSCGVVQYGMIDGSIDADTFSVEIFEEQDANAPSGYGATYTDYLKDYVISRTKLDLKNEGADIELFGKVTFFNTSPVAVQSESGAALNRLTVTINVTAINNVNEEQSFEQNFSQFSDFEAGQDLISVQDELLEDINEKLSQDVINKLTSNW
mgnify:CR=1 FL=1|jgi:hypothetical protein